LVDLGTLGGLTSSAWAVNGSGQVVGSSDTAGGPIERHAYVWTQDDGMVDLGTFGGTQSEARAINDSGQMVGDSSGSGVFPETHAALWNPASGDETPPVITIPSGVVADATSPTGVSVSYAASAVDDVDGVVAVDCSPPSGSTFTIGTTQVTCTASDAAGNNATASFEVHVKDAAEQIDDLIARVEGLRRGTSLTDKLAAAKAALALGNRTTACEKLDGFANEAEAQSGKKLTAAQAAELTASANRIRAVLGC
jgi:probable HAF family extracellular repeat protein